MATTITSSTSSATTTGPSETITGKTYTDGVSPGAAAGIGVGSAVAGAIIASGLLYLLWIHRLRARRAYGGHTVEKSQYGGGMKGPCVAATPAKSAIGTLDAALPQPMQDSDIKGEMSRLGTSIKNHVQSYYSGAPLSQDLSISAEQLFLVVGTDAPSSKRLYPRSSSVRAGAPPSATVAVIRYIVGWTILQSIQLFDPTETNLLPLGLAKYLSSMVPEAREPGGRLNPSSSANRAVVSKWRQLTAKLLQDKTSASNAFPLSDPRIHNVEKLASRLDELLAPYASSTDGGQRRQQLEELIKRGARFGWTLFSQPTEWTFDWEAASAGQTVVYPSLLQTSDDQGHVHREPLRFTDVQTVALQRS
ncbi:uncharacterized protein LTR77_009369 [Saxophila tyrrhenica]|uniref:Uncharacterized protein n=1 Tax=Saxophila tyrrhenica TaxID=1690608 RepID=A0AAV9NZU5_9PEZI|nr:hypothetical protein LTR77_009369 [Saxophila tyrrhenica]